MKSPHANRAELDALNKVPQAPFPLTPSAAVVKEAQAVKLAAVAKRFLIEEDELNQQASDAPQDDTIVQDGLTPASMDAQGAALEAIAPAPLPSGGWGLDTLLAQAGPAATAGGSGAAGVSTGAVLGVAGALVILGAATGGGDSSSPAPAPAPAAPPNKPASISVSYVQVAGEVYEDGEASLVTGNSAATALKIVDADGGADLKFRQPTADELQGKYGSFTFDTSTGIWSYALDPNDPDIKQLKYGSDNYEHLTVWSADGTASASIEVKIQPAFYHQSDAVIENRTTFLELPIADGFYLDGTDYSGPGDESTRVFHDGKFALYFAGNIDDDGSYQGQFMFSSDDGKGDEDNGRMYFSVLDDAELPDGVTPTFDGSWVVDLVEGEYGTLTKMSVLRDSDDTGGIYTLILDGGMNSDGGFMLDAVDGIHVVGNGSTEVAIQGTLDAINAYIDGGHIKMLFTSDYDDENWTEALLVDDTGMVASGSNFNFYASSYETVNDAPVVFLTTDDRKMRFGDGFMSSEDLDVYVPATGDPADMSDGVYELDEYARLWVNDEEADYDDWIELDLTASSGQLWISASYFDDYDVQIFVDGEWIYDGDGEYTSYYQNVSSIHLRAEENDVGALIGYTDFHAPDAFAVGATSTIGLTVTDDEGSQTVKNLTIHAGAQNQASYFSIDATSQFMDLAIVDTMQEDEGPYHTYTATLASATLKEDEQLDFRGVAVNDPDGSGSDKVEVMLSVYEWSYDIEAEWNGIGDGGGNLGYFYYDEAYESLVNYKDSGEISLYGSIDEINAMLASGGLHFALYVDYDAVLMPDAEEPYGMAVHMAVSDPGNGGYGSTYSDLYIAVDIEGTDDPLFILGEAKQYFGGDEGDELLLSNMTNSMYVFDAEANGDGGLAGNEQELTVTSVTVVDGSGTVAQTDGDWYYTIGADDLPGDHVKLSYVVTNGVTSMANTMDLEFYNYL